MNFDGVLFFPVVVGNSQRIALGYLASRIVEAVFLAVGVAEIFGLRVGLMLAVPGGLFELAFGSWLIVRGFRGPANDRGQT